MEESASSSYPGSIEDALLEAFLDSLSDSDIEDIILIQDSRPAKKLRSSSGLFSFDSLDATTARQMFRVEKDDIDRLARALRLPSSVKTEQRVTVGRTEALCIALRRLAYPNRLCDLEKIFGRHSSTLSCVASTVVRHIVSSFGHLLKDLRANPWLVPEALATFAQAVHRKGAPLQTCWGFIDGTGRPICRPSRGQQEYFSGHKRQHVVKYQSVMCPNGILCHTDGPYPGRRHDAGILRDSGFYQQLEELVAGHQYVLYGDPAYPLRPLLCQPYGGASGARAAVQQPDEHSTAIIGVGVSQGRV